MLLFWKDENKIKEQNKIKSFSYKKKEKKTRENTHLLLRSEK